MWLPPLVYPTYSINWANCLVLRLKCNKVEQNTYNTIKYNKNKILYQNSIFWYRWDRNTICWQSRASALPLRRGNTLQKSLISFLVREFSFPSETQHLSAFGILEGLDFFLFLQDATWHTERSSPWQMDMMSSNRLLPRKKERDFSSLTLAKTDKRWFCIYFITWIFYNHF